MTTMNATQFRKDLFSVLDSSILGNERVTITTKNGNAVLISEEDWDNIMETLYLLSVPDMMDSIKAADEDYPQDCLDWEICRKDIV